MTQSSRRGRLTFQSSAIYRIAIQGSLNKSWSERLAGMEITTEGQEEPVSYLSGPLPDQAALLGVLEALYDLHLPLLSVEVLGDESRDGEPLTDVRKEDP